MADFKTSIIRDSRINDITTQITYGVHKGASSNTYQSFPATSISDTMVSVAIQVPSENIIIDRNVLIDTDINFTLRIGPGVPVGSVAMAYGVTEALQAYPFNSLISTSNATINDTNVSTSLQDILPVLLRLNNTRDLYKYNGMTPSLPDQGFKRFSDSVATPSNPLGDFANSSYDVNLMPRGSHPVTYVVKRYANASPAVVADASLLSAHVGDQWDVDFTVHVTEPLIGLSPFIFGNPKYNNQGIVGVNGLNFVFNIDSSCKRLFSSASAYPMTLRLGANPFPRFRILLNFLSAQPSDLINPKNVVPYVAFPRYLSSAGANTVLAPAASTTIVSQTVQLAQLPDYFIIVARKPINTQTCKDTSSFLPISKINITMNNQSGLLASASQQDLWRTSVDNGSTQNWYEFSGYANRQGAQVSTVGSILMLQPARDLALPEYLSSGSVGQYTFQMELTVKNNDTVNFAPEVCIICVNSGVFTTLSGQSSISTGLLTKEIVINATMNENDAASSGVVKDMVGGSLNSIMNSAMRRLPNVNQRKLMPKMGAGAYSGGGHVNSLADLC
jgi:hypothetical protein